MRWGYLEWVTILVQYSTIHNSVCKVIEDKRCGDRLCAVYGCLNQDAVVRVPMAVRLQDRSVNNHIHPEIESHAYCLYHGLAA